MRFPTGFDDVKFALRQLIGGFNGGIDLVDNLSLKVVDAAPGAIAANTQQVITHRLGRVPRGVIVAGIEVQAGATSAVPGIIYFTNADLALWTAEVVYLRYTVSWNLHVTKLILF